MFIISEHFAENPMTLWRTVAKWWCVNFVHFFLEHPVHSSVSLSVSYPVFCRSLPYNLRECSTKLLTTKPPLLQAAFSSSDRIYKFCVLSYMRGFCCNGGVGVSEGYAVGGSVLGWGCLYPLSSASCTTAAALDNNTQDCNSFYTQWRRGTEWRCMGKFTTLTPHNNMLQRSVMLLPSADDTTWTF